MTSEVVDLDSAIHEITVQWRAERAERQARRHLDRGDFDLLRDAGLLKLAAPEEAGGYLAQRRDLGPPGVRALPSTRFGGSVGRARVGDAPNGDRVLGDESGSIPSGLGGAAAGGVRQRRRRRAVGNDHLRTGQRRRHQSHAGDRVTSRGASVPGWQCLRGHGRQALRKRVRDHRSDDHHGHPRRRVRSDGLRARRPGPTVGRERRAHVDRRMGRHGDGCDAEPRDAARRGPCREARVERQARCDHPSGRSVRRHDVHRGDRRRARRGDR